VQNLTGHSQSGHAKISKRGGVRLDNIYLWIRWIQCSTRNRIPGPATGSQSWKKKYVRFSVDLQWSIIESNRTSVRWSNVDISVGGLMIFSPSGWKSGQRLSLKLFLVGAKLNTSRRCLRWLGWRCVLWEFRGLSSRCKICRYLSRWPGHVESFLISISQPPYTKWSMGKFKQFTHSGSACFKALYETDPWGESWVKSSWTLQPGTTPQLPRHRNQFGSLTQPPQLNFLLIFQNVSKMAYWAPERLSSPPETAWRSWTLEHSNAEQIPFRG